MTEMKMTLKEFEELGRILRPDIMKEVDKQKRKEYNRFMLMMIK